MGPSTLNIITIIVTVSFSILSAVAYLLLRRERERKREYSELGYIREQLERQRYEIDARLSRDSKRWEEINHLLLTNRGKEDKEFYNKFDLPEFSSFFEQMGIYKPQIKVDKKMIFVLTPFHKNHFNTYKTIKGVCEKAGLKCIRGDEEQINNSDILPSIIRNILKARIVVANIDGRNPNVFYELGIAHAMGKSVIMVDDFEAKPFNVQSKFILMFESQTDLKEKLQVELIKHLAE